MTPELRDALTRLASAPERFLFFDYDGTLSPIVSRPEEAVTPPESIRYLRKLSRHSGTRVAVVTGRPLESIQKQVGAPDLVFAAVHGLVIHARDFHFVQPQAQRFQPTIRRAVGRLESALGGREGVAIEDKGLTVAVHYRRAAPSDAEDALRTSRRVAAELKGVRRLEGKKVVELGPDVDWDKGRAVELILERLCGPEWPGRLAVLYVGDDRTDEDAFRRLADRAKDAVTVHVGFRDPTAARYRVRDPDGVTEILAALARLLESPPGASWNKLEQP